MLESILVTDVVNTGQYAPFGKRFIAFMLDAFVLCLVMIATQFTIPYIAPFLVWVGYKALFESSSVQATPGKRAMDLIVVGADGKRITLGTSLLRTLVAWLSVFTCFAIYLVALFTKRKQTLHDLVADTFVVEGRLVTVETGKAWVDEVKQTYQNLRVALNQPEGISGEKAKIELIEKLNQLRSQGAITEEEYQARKRAILGSSN